MSADDMCVVDVRPLKSFEAGHIPGSIAFPASELILRSGELPPRNKPLCVVHTEGDENELGVASAFFQRAKWVIQKCVPLATNATGYEGGALEIGPQPSGLRFWEPSPFVTDMLTKYLTGNGIVCDFGCGSGRDMAFLAGLGWNAIGIDNRDKLLRQASAMHNRYGTQRCGTVDGIQAQLAGSPFFRERIADLVLMVRFLHRPSIPTMLSAVAVGGYFLCSHFVDGVQHSAVGTPKSPDAFLEHDEMLRWFAKDGGYFEVLHNEETIIEDGRPIVNILAKRIK